MRRDNAGAFQWVQAPPGDTLQPEAIGAGMEEGAPGIDNISDIDNGYDDPHSIVGYLSDKRIADAIVVALRQNGTSRRPTSQRVT